MDPFFTPEWDGRPNVGLERSQAAGHAIEIWFTEPDTGETEMQKMFNQQPDPREISNSEAASVYLENGATFVDVREPEEWAEGHMPGAVHIPLGDLAKRANELPTDGKIVTVCKAGGRSLNAVDILKASGREDAVSMAGGMDEWSKNGRPVE
jgi:rhodanese-related sulfurtransferase